MPSGYVTGARVDPKAGAAPIVCRNQRPQCPRYLPRPAKRVWSRIVPALASDGVLANVDAMQLGNLCIAQATLERLQLMLFEMDDWTSKRGLISLISSARQQQLIVTKLANDFGMSIKARAALGESLRNPNIHDPATEDSEGVERLNPRLKAVA